MGVMMWPSSRSRSPISMADIGDWISRFLLMNPNLAKRNFG